MRKLKMSHVAGAAVVMVGLAFGLMGGEYTTPDWLQLKRDVAEQERVLDALRREIDSLRFAADSLVSDSTTLERVAREELGMLRDGEVLFRITAPRLDRAPEALTP